MKGNEFKLFLTASIRIIVFPPRNACIRLLPLMAMTLSQRPRPGARSRRRRQKGLFCPVRDGQFKAAHGFDTRPSREHQVMPGVARGRVQVHSCQPSVGQHSPAVLALCRYSLALHFVYFAVASGQLVSSAEQRALVGDIPWW